MQHSPSLTHGIKIDWDAEVERTDELRAAVPECETLRAGMLLRGFVIGKVTYPRGTLVFRVAEGHELSMQMPVDVTVERTPRSDIEPTWAIDHDDAGVERHRGVVGTRDAGERIDLIIAARAPNISRAKAKKLLDDGCVSIGGQSIRKSSHRSRADDVIELVVVDPSQG